MASIKFEEQIKKTLEQRKITPSSDTWNVLAKKLDNSEKKKNKTAIWWKAIAAIFIGVLFSLTLFFNTNDKHLDPALVDVKEQPVLKLDESIIKEELEEQILIANKKPENKVLKSIQKSTSRTAIEEPISTNNTYLNTKVAENARVKNLEKNLRKNIEEISEEVALVKKTDVNKVPDIDNEVIQLLEAAKKAVAIQQKNDKTSKIIDADALLWSVENNIDLSLKDKILLAVKTGYKTLTVAYEKRNN
jgi:DNA-binding ferritin-like protein (Dps family)